MSATNTVLLLPISKFEQLPAGEQNLTPLVNVTASTSGSTIKAYLGIPTVGLAAVKFVITSTDGTIVATQTATINADLTSATYTTTGSETWNTTAGAYSIYAYATVTGDVSAPGATATRYYSKPVIIVVA